MSPRDERHARWGYTPGARNTGGSSTGTSGSRDDDGHHHGFGHAVGSVAKVVGAVVVGDVLVNGLIDPLASGLGVSTRGNFDLFGNNVRFNTRPGRIRSGGGFNGGGGQVATFSGFAETDAGDPVTQLLGKIQDSMKPGLSSEQRAVILDEVRATLEQPPYLKGHGKIDLPKRTIVLGRDAQTGGVVTMGLDGKAYHSTAEAMRDLSGALAFGLNRVSGPNAVQLRPVPIIEGEDPNGQAGRMKYGELSYPETQNGQANGGTSQQTGDKGAAALAFSEKVAIAVSALAPDATKEQVIASFGLDAASLKTIQESIATAPEDVRTKFRENLDRGIDNAFAKLTPEQQADPKYKENLTQIHGYIKQISELKPGQASQSQATEAATAARIGVMERLKFDTSTEDGKKAQEQWNQLIGQEKTQMKGDFTAIFSKIISMIINMISGHPEMNSPEDFIKAHETQLPPGQKAQDWLDALKNPSAAATPGTAPVAGADGKAATDKAEVPQPAVVNPADVAKAKIAKWDTLDEKPIVVSAPQLTTLQTELQEVGLYTITVDGKPGRGTTAAIGKAEEILGLAKDGKDDAKLEAALANPDVRAAMKAFVATGATGGAKVQGDPPPPAGGNVKRAEAGAVAPGGQ